jgi:glycolate oxidase FAD binding subunit
MGPPGLIVEQAFVSLDELGSLPAMQPASVAQLCELVLRAAAEGHAIYPVGGQTMLDLGLPPSKPGMPVDLRRLDQVIDYPARDMTVTAQAGITIAKLQSLLKGENQQLPIDVPLPERATLGGALAVNSSGPRRYGYGTLRDYVIGISVVNDEGHEIKAGGRVVKNVAGYDLCKLYIGSLGTLGIITQVTLKVKPRPQSVRLLTLPCPGENFADLLNRLHESRTRPMCIDVLSRAADEALSQQLDGTADLGPSLPANWWRPIVGFDGNPTTVAWQIKQLSEELPEDSRRLSCELADADAEVLLARLADFLLWPEAKLTLKANVLPHMTAEFSKHVLAFSPALVLQIHAGNGIVIIHQPGDSTQEQTQELVQRLSEWASAAGGNLIVQRAPAAWKKTLPVWGRPRDDAWLMREIKAKLDSRGLFNPGRFVAGI